MFKGILLVIFVLVVFGASYSFYKHHIFTASLTANNTVSVIKTNQMFKEGNNTPIKNGKNLPANIFAKEDKNSKTYFILDYLELNPCFTPGGPLKPGCTNSNFLKNEIEERSKVPLSSNIKVFYCFVEYGDHVDHGLSGNDTVPDAPYPLKDFLNQLDQNSLPRSYYFDIENNEISVVYEQCLP